MGVLKTVKRWASGVALLVSSIVIEGAEEGDVLAARSDGHGGVEFVPTPADDIGGGDEGGGGGGGGDPVLATPLVRLYAPGAGVSYAVGQTMLDGHGPSTSNNSMLPLVWTIPAKAGDVEPQVIFTFHEVGGTGVEVITRTNSTGAPVEETFAELLAAGVFDACDGYACDGVNFAANNVGMSPDVQSLGSFALRGYQV